MNPAETHVPDAERPLPVQAGGGPVRFEVIIGNGLIGKWDFSLRDGTKELDSGAGWSDQGERTFALDPAVAIPGTELTVRARVFAPAAASIFSVRIQAAQAGTDLLHHAPVRFTGPLAANAAKFLSARFTVA